MPLYEYQCDACGHRFERIVKFSDPPLETCPSCGGPVRKLISSPAFQFKGSGWYVTDYAKKEHVPAGKAGGAESESSGKAQDEKGAKSEKAAQGEKSDKTEKTEKSDKPDKSEKGAKSETGSSAGASTSSSATASSPGSSASSPKKES